MRTDGLFGFRHFDIKAEYNKPISLIFRGDIHYNSPAHASREFADDNKRLKETVADHDTYFISTGDTFESLSTSERHHFSAGGFHDSNTTRWEAAYYQEIDDYVNQVPFKVGRTLAVFGGNHYFSFSNGVTSEQILAERLKAQYIGTCGYVIITLHIGQHKCVVKALVHHGKSAGRKAGSGLNAPEEAASYFADADIVVMGHSHQTCVAKIASLYCNRGYDTWKVRAKDRIIGRSGSYLKSYEPDKKSYSVDAMYRPSSLGYLEVLLTPRCTDRVKEGEHRWVELNAVI